MSDARATHVAGREARERERKALDARAYAIGTARLIVAVAVVALIVGIAWMHLPRGAWIGIVGLAIVFGGLVVVHARVHAKMDRAAAAARFHTRALARIDGAWRELPSTGARFDRDDHPYAEDLDLFGRASLFQLLDRTETRFGEERLAAWLGGAGGPSIEVLRARQAAARELAARVDLREQLSAIGAVIAEGKPDPTPFLSWAEGAMPTLPTFAPLARLLPPITVGLLAFAPALGLPAPIWLLPLLVQLGVIAATGPSVRPIAAAVTASEGAFARYAEMLALLEEAKLEAPALRALQEKLRASGARATEEMARLQRTLSFLEARNNEVWRLIIGPLLLWDLNFVIPLERWRERVGGRVRGWFEALAELEALASFAAFAFEEPAHAWPELVGDARLEAEGLGHPLLHASTRVANDVSLVGPGAALVVTGSNMSGKTTLLRAMGVNAVLARAGAPVCARRMRIGPVAVVTSMRVRDSLSEGVSRFYAEVKKLKRVIEQARTREPTLFLLDEVLHGTNSRERLIGARAVLRELLACGAIGAVSTHDLAIGDLEEALPGKVQNVHFEEQVKDGVMTFDYRLRGGVVQSSNALRIMRMVGIDVVDPGA